MDYPYHFHLTSAEKSIWDVGGRRQWATTPYGFRFMLWKPVTINQWSVIADGSSASAFVDVGPSNCWIAPIGTYLAGEANTADGDFGTRLHALADSRLPPDPNPMDLWDRAKPTMETRANLSVFLYELRDLKRMFEVLPVKHFNRKWKDIFRYSRGRPTGRQGWLKYVNDQHLNLMFGWRPFLSDVKKFYRGMATFDERLSRFVNQAGQDLSRHRKKGPITTTIDESWTLPYDSHFRARLIGQIESTYAAAFRFAYSLPDYSPEELRWRAWADTLGARIDLATIWAVIPWSFVVDWFVTVGKSLEQNSVAWVEPYVNLHQAYHSARYSYSFTLELYPQGGWTGPGSTVGRITGSKYVRTIGMPRFTIETPDLDANKIRLLASLGLSRVL